MRRATTNPTTGPVAMYLSELSEGSRRTMRFALATAAGFFGGSDYGGREAVRGNPPRTCSGST